MRPSLNDAGRSANENSSQRNMDVMTESRQIRASRSSLAITTALFCVTVGMICGCKTAHKNSSSIDLSSPSMTASPSSSFGNSPPATQTTDQFNDGVISQQSGSKLQAKQTSFRQVGTANNFTAIQASNQQSDPNSINGSRAAFIQEEVNNQPAPNLEIVPGATQDSTNSPPTINLADPTNPMSPANPMNPVIGNPIDAPAAINSVAGQLSLVNVLQSVESCLPQIEMALQQIEAADGKLLASMGEFDTVLSGESLSQPLGFYETYRNQLGIAQPLWGGGEVYGTYRMGDGNFEPWYGERETNEGGELKAGFSIPLLKNNDIDERRANVLGAAAMRTQTRAGLGIEVLNAQRMAAATYWNWVAAGQALNFRKQLLKLAEARVDKIKILAESGDQAKLIRLTNNQFIAKRTSDLIKARRKLQEAAIKLSIYYRDANCQPVIVNESQLPQFLPVPKELSQQVIEDGIAAGTTSRPEIRELDAIRQQYEIALRYAENLLLPKLDLKGFAGQDLGGLTSKKGDKQPLEIQAGVVAELPWQRREGLGKSKEAQAKLTQLNAKLQLTTDKIRAEITDAASAINNAARRYKQASENLKLTEEARVLGELLFESGDIDIIGLNIYETSVATAQFDVLDAELEFAVFQIIYRTAISSGEF